MDNRTWQAPQGEILTAVDPLVLAVQSRVAATRAFFLAWGPHTSYGIDINSLDDLIKLELLLRAKLL